MRKSERKRARRALPFFHVIRLDADGEHQEVRHPGILESLLLNDLDSTRKRLRKALTRVRMVSVDDDARVVAKLDELRGLIAHPTFNDTLDKSALDHRDAVEVREWVCAIDDAAHAAYLIERPARHDKKAYVRAAIKHVNPEPKRLYVYRLRKFVDQQFGVDVADITIRTVLKPRKPKRPTTRRNLKRAT